MASEFSPDTVCRGVLLLVLLASSSAYAQPYIFQPNWEQAAWRLEKRPETCAMTQDIPRFGQARFEQQPGRRLALSLSTHLPANSDQQVRVVSQAPPWKHGVETAKLGDTGVKKGATRVVLSPQQARRIYLELEQGMQQLLQFADWGSGTTPVQALLSPLRFRQVLPEFLACTGALVQLDFEVLESKTLFFATDSDRLDRLAQQALDRLARRWRKQRDFRIVLGGHADARGTPVYNQRLSRRRADRAARFLRQRGVSKKAIESHHYGENRPSDPANNASAWARNRRVSVWLAEAR